MNTFTWRIYAELTIESHVKLIPQLFRHAVDEAGGVFADGTAEVESNICTNAKN